VLKAAPQTAQEVAAALVERLPDVHLVGVVGRTLVLYRPHPEQPRICLPT
jgi:RNA-binding protein YhbY